MIYFTKSNEKLKFNIYTKNSELGCDLIFIIRMSNDINEISWYSLSSNVEAQNDGYLSNVEDCKVSISVESPSNWWIDLMLLLDSFEETSFFSFWFSCDWL